VSRQTEEPPAAGRLYPGGSSCGRGALRLDPSALSGMRAEVRRPCAVRTLHQHTSAPHVFSCPGFPAGSESCGSHSQQGTPVFSLSALFPRPASGPGGLTVRQAQCPQPTSLELSSGARGATARPASMSGRLRPVLACPLLRSLYLKDSKPLDSCQALVLENKRTLRQRANAVLRRVRPDHALTKHSSLQRASQRTVSHQPGTSLAAEKPTHARKRAAYRSREPAHQAARLRAGLADNTTRRAGHARNHAAHRAAR